MMDSLADLLGSFILEGQQRQQPVLGDLLADSSGISIQTIRAMKESGLLDNIDRPKQPAQQMPNYRGGKGQEYYDKRTRRHPRTGQPMTEEEYQGLMRALGQRGSS